MEVTAVYDLDEAVFLRGWSLFKAVRLGAIQGWSQCLLAVPFLLGAVFGHWWRVTGLCFGLVIAAGFLVAMAWRKAYLDKSRAGLQGTLGALGPKRLRFDAAGFSNGDGPRAAWSSLTALWSGAGLMILVLGPDACCSIPLDAFADAAQAQQVRAWAQAQGVKLVTLG